MAEGKTKMTPLVEIHDGVMEFPGVKALDQVNFTLMPGECHALVGENGAGKSTLSKCITGENQMTKGDLLIKGEKIKRISKERRCNCTSRVYFNGRYDGGREYFRRKI